MPSETTEFTGELAANSPRDMTDSAADAATGEPSDPSELSALSTRDLVTSWGMVEEGFRNTHRVIAADIEADGLPIQWFEVLMRLLRTPDHRLPMNRLAAEIDMTSGGYTKLVDRLEAADLVERVPAVDDRRVIYTSLTDAGRAAAEQAMQRHELHLREVVLAQLCPEQLHDLADLMRVLRDAHQITSDDADPETAPATGTEPDAETES